MDIKDFYRSAKRTINPSLTWEELKIHALLGIGGETGEIQDIYKKSYQGHEVIKERVMEELGDLCWHIMELCYAQHIDPEEMLEYNVDKLNKRYHSGFDTQRSIHRE